VHTGASTALHATTGEQRWAFTTGDDVRSSTALSADDATNYVGSRDKKVYALDAATAAQRWAFSAGGYVHCSPALSAGGGGLTRAGGSVGDGGDDGLGWLVALLLLLLVVVVAGGGVVTQRVTVERGGSRKGREILLRLLCLVCSGSLPVARAGTVTVVAFKGFEYRILDGTAPTDTSNRCQDEYMALPVGGWALAPDDADAAAVAGAYSWGTSCLVLANGDSIRSVEYAADAGKKCDGCGSSQPCFSQSGNQYKVTSCYRRILLRRPCAAGGHQGPLMSVYEEAASSSSSSTKVCTSTSTSAPSCEVVFSGLASGARITIDVVNTDFSSSSEYITSVRAGSQSLGSRFLVSGGSDDKCDLESRILDDVQVPDSAFTGGQMTVRIETSSGVGDLTCSGYTLKAEVTVQQVTAMCPEDVQCEAAAGSYCPLRAPGPNTGESCPAGFYCPGGSSDPQQCPARTHSPRQGALARLLAHRIRVWSCPFCGCPQAGRGLGSPVCPFSVRPLLTSVSFVRCELVHSHHGGRVQGVRVPGPGRHGADGHVERVSGRVHGPARRGVESDGVQCRRGGGDGRVSLGDDRSRVCGWAWCVHSEMGFPICRLHPWIRQVGPIRKHLQTFRLPKPHPPPPPVRGRRLRGVDDNARRGFFCVHVPARPVRAARCGGGGVSGVPACITLCCGPHDRPRRARVSRRVCVCCAAPFPHPRYRLR